MSKLCAQDTRYCQSFFNDLGGAIDSKVVRRIKPINKRLEYVAELLNDARVNSSNFKNIDDVHYRIASIYTLLMSEKERKEKAAFFTPPVLTKYLIETVEYYGANFKSGKVLDPAAGGAAFLSSAAVKMKELGCENSDIVERLYGLEIDEGLAKLAQLIVADRLGVDRIKKIVNICDSMQVKPNGKYDIVLANPPYGRILSPKKEILDIFAQVIDPTHVNLYVLFVFLSVMHCAPKGVIGLVIPLSFIGGPAFGLLRSWLLKNTNILRLDVIDGRTGVFLNVKQDTCVLILQRRELGSEPNHKFDSGMVLADGSRKKIGHILVDTDLSKPWRLPIGTFSSSKTKVKLTATLEDYGYTTKTGYFVWNREKQRVRQQAKLPREKGLKFYPLIWAKNIFQEKSVVPASKDNLAIDFVAFTKDSSAIIYNPCLVLQRTSNTKQARRLVVGKISRKTIKKWGGIVSENHTILIIPNGKPVLNVSLMCELLASEEVDIEYRRMSGAVNVSTVALRDLKLPAPEIILSYLRGGLEMKEAVKLAFEDRHESSH